MYQLYQSFGLQKKLTLKIKLNVGGKIFTTSKTTLLSVPGSYFHALLSSGKWLPDEDNEYFIDRSPKVLCLSSALF